MGLLMPVTIIPKTTNNMTGTSVITSSVVHLILLNSAAIQAIWTGSPVGTFSVQSSLNYSENPDGSVNNAGTWDDLGIGVTAPSGTSGHALIDLSLTGTPYVRLVYTNSSGTGTLSAMASGK